MCGAGARSPLWGAHARHAPPPPIHAHRYVGDEWLRIGRSDEAAAAYNNALELATRLSDAGAVAGLMAVMGSLADGGAGGGATARGASEVAAAVGSPGGGSDAGRPRRSSFADARSAAGGAAAAAPATSKEAPAAAGAGAAARQRAPREGGDPRLLAVVAMAAEGAGVQLRFARRTAKVRIWDVFSAQPPTSPLLPREDNRVCACVPRGANAAEPDPAAMCPRGRLQFRLLDFRVRVLHLFFWLLLIIYAPLATRILKVGRAGSGGPGGCRRACVVILSMGWSPWHALFWAATVLCARLGARADLQLHSYRRDVVPQGGLPRGLLRQHVVVLRDLGGRGDGAVCDRE